MKDDINEYDIIVVDAEYIQAEEYINYQCSLADILINNYSKCLSNIINDSISSGQLNDALIEFQKYVSKLQNINGRIASKYMELCDLYLSQIDNADDILYESRFSGNVKRVFTDEEKQKLVKVFRQSCGRRIIGFLEVNISKFLGLFFDSMKRVAEEEERRLNEYNKLKEKTVVDIFEKVREIDKEYALLIEENLQGDKVGTGLDMFTQTINSEIAVIRTMGDLLGNGSDKLTVESIKTNLNPLFDEMNKLIDTTLYINVEEPEIILEQIERFVEFSENETFYEDYEAILKEEYDYRTWADEVGNKILNGDDVFIACIVGDAYMPDDIKKDSNLAYEYLVLKKHYSSVINSVVGNSAYNKYMSDVIKQYKESDFATIYGYISKGTNLVKVDDKNNLNLYKKYLSDFQELNKYYTNILKSLGYVGDFEKIIAPLCYDYAKNIELIESVCGNIDDGSMSYHVMQGLIMEYKHKYLKLTKDLLEKSETKLYEKTADEVLKFIIGSENLAAIKLSLELSKEITGLGSAYESIVEFKILYKSNKELIANYNKCFKAAKDAGENITQKQATDLQNAFNLLKNTYKKEFNDLYNYYRADDVPGASEYMMYYKQQMLNIDKLKMDNDKPLTELFLSMDEYRS